MLRVYVVQGLDKIFGAPLLCRLIDHYGNFSRDLCDLHHRVALQRCALETAVKTYETDIAARTRIIIGTMAAIAKSSHVRMLTRAMPDAVVDTIVVDEATRNMHFDLVHFMKTFSSWIDSQTRLALLGDPTQLHCRVELLALVSAKSANWDVVIFHLGPFWEHHGVP